MRGRVVSVLAATERGFSKYLHIIVDEIVQSISKNYEYARDGRCQPEHRSFGELRRVLPRSNECIELFVAERKRRTFYCG